MPEWHALISRRQPGGPTGRDLSSPEATLSVAMVAGWPSGYESLVLLILLFFQILLFIAKL